MANSDNIKNDAALVDVSQIKAINKVSFKQRMKAYKRKPLSLVLLILVGLAAALSAAAHIYHCLCSCARCSEPYPRAVHLSTTATMYRVCRQLSTQLFLRL